MITNSFIYFLEGLYIPFNLESKNRRVLLKKTTCTTNIYFYIIKKAPYLGLLLYFLNLYSIISVYPDVLLSVTF